MDQLFNYILSTPYGEYAMLLALVAYVLSHVIQYLPHAWTEKIPDWVMVILNFLAAKHGAEKAAKTDMSGNRVIK